MAVALPYAHNLCSERSVKAKTKVSGAVNRKNRIAETAEKTGKYTNDTHCEILEPVEILLV